MFVLGCFPSTQNKNKYINTNALKYLCAYPEFTMYYPKHLGLNKLQIFLQLRSLYF